MSFLLPVFFSTFDQNWPTGEEVLEEWTQKVAEEHKSHWYCLGLYLYLKLNNLCVHLC